MYFVASAEINRQWVLDYRWIRRLPSAFACTVYDGASPPRISLCHLPAVRTPRRLYQPSEVLRLAIVDFEGFEEYGAMRRKR